MPKVRRKRLPDSLFDHLALRMRERQISVEQLGVLTQWLDADPEVPEGRWFKRFGDFTLCGEGELAKTFLVRGQLPDGEEVD